MSGSFKVSIKKDEDEDYNVMEHKLLLKFLGMNNLPETQVVNYDEGKNNSHELNSLVVDLDNWIEKEEQGRIQDIKDINPLTRGKKEYFVFHNNTPHVVLTDKTIKEIKGPYCEAKTKAFNKVYFGPPDDPIFDEKNPKEFIKSVREMGRFVSYKSQIVTSDPLIGTKIPDLKTPELLKYFSEKLGIIRIDKLDVSKGELCHMMERNFKLTLNMSENDYIYSYEYQGNYGDDFP
jgi:hypothetical protein